MTFKNFIDEVSGRFYVKNNLGSINNSNIIDNTFIGTINMQNGQMLKYIFYKNLNFWIASYKLYNEENLSYKDSDINKDEMVFFPVWFLPLDDNRIMVEKFLNEYNKLIK
jgi:hypothetical protein